MINFHQRFIVLSRQARLSLISGTVLVVLGLGFGIYAYVSHQSGASFLTVTHPFQPPQHFYTELMVHVSDCTAPHILDTFV